MKVLQWLWKFTYYGLVVFFLCLLAVLIIFAVSAPSCDAESEAVLTAKGLSKSQLKQLYEDFMALDLGALPPFAEYSDLEEHKIPKAFSYLSAEKMNPRGSTIMLEGCFDHYVYLKFCGLQQSSCKGKSIELQYGDGPNIVFETIWQSDDDA